MIKGVGSYVPKNRLTNYDLERLVETSDEWIRTRTGIVERRICGPTEATSDLAYFAAQAALADAGISPTDIDQIIVATETPDHVFPPVACQVQNRLGCRNVGAFDIHSTCVGFLSALQVAEQYVKMGTHKHVLVIGADSLSRFTDYTDRVTCVLFADGAGAFVISRREASGSKAGSKGIISTLLHSDGKYFEALYVPAGGSRHPDPAEGLKNKIVMDGKTIFKLAVNVMSEAVEETLRATGYAKEEIDWLIPHQANQRIIDAVASSLGFPNERIISTISQYGNNSAATIPLAIDTAVRDSRIRRGDTLMLVAFGAGLVSGAVLLQY